ncbi:DUF5753 domain-containing protein [Streptomyces chrestomyceticus]|uniref:DUF5753 domain-containing protein n=1 Tax=Streptomyces chrestomyceticus TaxID=68185 RepID=UPI003688D2F2
MLQVADQMCGSHGFLEAAHEYMKPEKCTRRIAEYMDLEKTAVGLYWYEPLYIPGLLQTEEYVCELLNRGLPPLSDETVEERIAFRLQRRELLNGADALYAFVIYEAALRAVVGGAEVMKRQLDRLLEVQRLRNVCVQILPVDRAPYCALAGPVVVIETAEHETYAYMTGQGTSVLQSDPSDVSRQRRAFGVVRGQALSVQDSDEFIRQVAKEL